MKKIFPLIFGVAMMMPSFAQEIQTIRMNVKSEKKNPVVLDSLSVETVVFGNIATTTLDMIFSNSSDRVLEGELEFPLSQGESVVGYALDINGSLREGVVVEKEKGREVFDAVVRRGIDPGLVEKTSGNNFRTRVYPLPAKGKRHVRIVCEGELSSFGKERKYVFSALPQNTLSSFSFKLTILDDKKSDEELKLSEKDGLSAIDLSSLTGGKTFSFEKENYTADKALVFTIPGDAGKNIVYTDTRGKDTYFYAWLPLEEKSLPKAEPKKIAIYYDTSSSREERNKAREEKLLRSYLSKLSSVQVSVIPFCNTVQEEKTFSGLKGDKLSSQVMSFINTLAFDGATNLDLDFSASDADEILLFTDGVSNWKTSSERGKTKALVYTINSSSKANHDFLTKLASVNGGSYANLNSLSDTEALSLLSKSRYHLTGIEYDEKLLSDVMPLYSDLASESFSLCGKLIGKKGDVKLNFGFANETKESLTLTVDVKAPEYKSVSRLWAGAKIRELSVNYDENRKEIIETAKKFSVVTDETSLIVLDSVSDYVRYGIVPPKELLEDYNRLVKNQGTFKPGDVSGIPSSVYSCFEEFKKWWGTKPGEFKKKEKKVHNGPNLFGMRRTMAVEDAPMMMMESMVEPSEDLFDMEASSVRETGLPDSIAANASAKMSAKAMGKLSSTEASFSKVTMMAWNPDSPYLSVLKKTDSDKMYEKYLSLKKEYGASPAFYIEVSDYFLEENMSDLSLRILSNLAELNLENSDLLRALANKLVEHGNNELAVPIFEKLVKIRGEIPQFYRDLALAYKNTGRNQEAVDTLYKIVTRSWDSRFNEIQQIALNDMNSIIAQEGKKIDTSAIDKKLMENFDLDVRVVLTWNTDDCDVDLWVTDKAGEKCYYGNRYTANGARLSRDFTQGYGPEEFCIKKAPGGKLSIDVNYYGNHQQKQMQPVIVQAEVYTNFGRANQKCQILTLQLDDVKQTFHVGDVD